MVAAAVTCGSVAVIVAALAAVYTWHRLRGPVPLVAWAASVCVRPQGKRATGLEEVSTPFKVPKNGVVQVKHRHLCTKSVMSTVHYVCVCIQICTDLCLGVQTCLVVVISIPIAEDRVNSSKTTSALHSGKVAWPHADVPQLCVICMSRKSTPG